VDGAGADGAAGVAGAVFRDTARRIIWTSGNAKPSQYANRIAPTRHSAQPCSEFGLH